MKINVLLLFLSSTIMVLGQQQFPEMSPRAKVEQKVGFKTITVDYSRPSIRDRVIFGGLVPYGEKWRTGANDDTKITFSGSVLIKGDTISSGTYSIFTMPNKKNWNFYLYDKSIDDWGGVPDNDPKSPPRAKWDESKLKLLTSVPSYKLSQKIETMMFSFQDITGNGANLVLEWENTGIKVPITFFTNERIENTINNKLAGVTAWDYYSFANYYVSEGIKLEKALEYTNKSIKQVYTSDGKLADNMNTQSLWFILRLKTNVLKKMGRKKEALKMVKGEMRDELKKIEAENPVNINFFRVETNNLISDLERFK